MFLEILGWIFLVILVIVAYFGWKIYRFVKRQSNSDFAVALSVLPDQNMELEPSNSEEWVEKERLNFVESDLKKIGAKHLGYYCVFSGYAIIKTAIWDMQGKAAIVIYEASSTLDETNVTFMMEVASKTNDGSVCISTNPSVTYSDRPSNHVALHKESQSILELIKAIKPAIPEGKKLIKITDPIDFFLECYQDVCEYAWRKEQLLNNQTQQTLTSVGVKVSDELMNELIAMGENYSVEVFTERARKKLAKHSTMTVEQWEKIRDKIIVINDRMKVEHIVDEVYNVLGDLTENQEQVLEGFQANTKTMVDPLAAFKLLAQALNLKVKRMVKMESPVKTEIYLPYN